MREVGAAEAGNKLGTLLDWVEAGEEVLITRRGKAVARLVPAEPGFDRAKARRAAAGLLEVRRGVARGGLKIKDLVKEGQTSQLATRFKLTLRDAAYLELAQCLNLPPATPDKDLRAAGRALGIALRP